MYVLKLSLLPVSTLYETSTHADVPAGHAAVPAGGGVRKPAVYALPPQQPVIGVVAGTSPRTSTTPDVSE